MTLGTEEPTLSFIRYLFYNKHVSRGEFERIISKENNVPTPEEIVFGREAAARKPAQDAAAAERQRLLGELDQHVADALKNLAKHEYPVVWPHVEHETIIWKGEKKLSWMLRDGRGDGDSYQVHLLSDGTLLESSSEPGEWYTEYQSGYYIDVVVRSLESLAKSEFKPRPPEPYVRRWN